jgi:hypothetical protein
MSSDRKSPDPGARKKPYRSPRLTVHGNLRTLTKATGTKNGSMNDGAGLPKTRA